MAWTANTTPLDGSTGFTLASIDTGSGMVDTAVITSVADWDNEDFDHGDAIAIKQGDTTVLYGKVVKVEPYAQGGGAQGRRYTIANAWYDLEQITYKQLFHYANAPTTTEQKWRSKVWLGTNAAGGRITTLAVIQDLLDYAIDTAEVSMSYVLGSFGVVAPVTEASDQTVAALILQCLRWHPNVQAYWRYTASSGTLHIKPISELSTVTLTVAGADPGDPQPITAQVAPRNDQVPPCVIVKYERVNQFDDPETGTTSLIEYHEDKAGMGSEHSPGALCYTIELQGLRSTSVVQPVRTRTVPSPFADDADPETPSSGTQATAAKWYQSHIGALKAIPVANIRVDEHLKVFDTNEVEEAEEDLDDSPPVPPEGDPSDYPRELLDGTIQEWMTGIKANPMIARGKFGFKGTTAGFTADQLRIAKLVFGELLDQERTYYVRYMATDARTQRYRTVAGFEAAEDWPTGLASAVYNDMSTVRYDGTVTVRDTSCYLGVKPGMFLTLDGQTGSGPVQRCTFDPQSGKTTITFGWPGHRTPQDLFELQKASRANEMTATYAPGRRGAAQASASNQSVQGALRGPINDVQPTGGVGEGGHPFKVSPGSDSTHIAIQFGTVSGAVDDVIPTIGGVSMAHDPAPECAASSGDLPYIKFNMTPVPENRGTVGSPDWWISGGFCTTSTIAAVATAPVGSAATIDRMTGDVTDGEYYRLIASISDGKWSNGLRYSLQVTLCDDGEGNGNISFGVSG